MLKLALVTIGTISIFTLAIEAASSLEPPQRPLDAFVAANHAVFLLEVEAPHTLRLTVTRESRRTETEFALRSLPENTAIHAGMVIPWTTGGDDSDEILAALTVEEQGGHSYHFLINPTPGGESPFLLSTPFFQSQGEPFSIIDVKAMGPTADGVNITLRRGAPSKKNGIEAVEEYLYVDVCTPVGVAGSKLYDLRSGRPHSNR